MIIRCCSCGKRVSDQMETCPHCRSPLANLTREQQTEFTRRRLRNQLHRARFATNLAMLTVLIGLFWWWLGGQSLMLDWPAPPVPLFMAAAGLIGYLVSRGWLLYIQIALRRRR